MVVAAQDMVLGRLVAFKRVSSLAAAGAGLRVRSMARVDGSLRDRNLIASYDVVVGGSANR